MLKGDTPAQDKIKKEIFEKLCAYQCTEEEIAGIFGVDADTLLTWCKKTYNGTFSDTFKNYSQEGKISLRRAMFKNAIDNQNPAIQIWLSKQYLGMTDKQEIVSNVNVNPYSNLTEEELRRLADE